MDSPSGCRYISRGEWFDKGTEAILLDDYRTWGSGELQVGLFRGVKDGKPDEEVCTFDEFETVLNG